MFEFIAEQFKEALDGLYPEIYIKHCIGYGNAVRMRDEICSVDEQLKDIGKELTNIQKERLKNAYDHICNFIERNVPILILEHEGRGNNLKTILHNIDEIAISLQCTPQSLMKFIRLRLGVQAKYDTNTKNGVIQGFHKSSELSQCIHMFIRKE